jgi:hypothetical protein
MGLLIDKKQKHTGRVLAEKLDNIGVRLEHTPGKSLKCLGQYTRVSESSTRTAAQLLHLRFYKTTIIHARLAAARSSYQDLFLLLASTLCL